MSARIDRLRQELAQAEEQRRQCIRAGRLIIPKKITDRIAFLQKTIQEEESYLPVALVDAVPAEELKRSNICREMVKAHIVADLLSDVMLGIKEQFKRWGLVDSNIFHVVSDIQKLSQRYADAICTTRFGELRDYMVSNEALIDKLHETINADMAKRIRVIDK